MEVCERPSGLIAGELRSRSCAHSEICIHARLIIRLARFGESATAYARANERNARALPAFRERGSCAPATHEGDGEGDGWAMTDCMMITDAQVHSQQQKSSSSLRTSSSAQRAKRGEEKKERRKNEEKERRTERDTGLPTARSTQVLYATRG